MVKKKQKYVVLIYRTLLRYVYKLLDIL